MKYLTPSTIISESVVAFLKSSMNPAYLCAMALGVKRHPRNRMAIYLQNNFVRYMIKYEN